MKTVVSISFYKISGINHIIKSVKKDSIFLNRFLEVILLNTEKNTANLLEEKRK